MKSNERSESMTGESPNSTILTFGLVIRIDAERISDLRRALSDIEARIIYQKISGGRLIIVEEGV